MYNCKYTTSIVFMIAAVRIHFKLTKGLVYTRLQINFLCVQRKNVYMMQDTIFVTYQQILQADITICFPIEMHNISSQRLHPHIHVTMQFNQTL